MAHPPSEPRIYTDAELLTATVFPCTVCGSPVEVTPRSRIGTLRRRIEQMRRAGWSTLVTDDYTVHRLDADLAELATVPVTCPHGRHLACPLHWAECRRCCSPFLARRTTARWCSVKCRVANHRAQA
jgi:hypothetical protein